MYCVFNSYIHTFITLSTIKLILINYVTFVLANKSIILKLMLGLCETFALTCFVHKLKE